MNTSLAPAPDDKPDKAYKQEVACVTRDQSAASVVLRDIPWGQQYLQINEVHSHMRAAVQGHAGKTAAGEAVRVAVIDTGVGG